MPEVADEEEVLALFEREAARMQSVYRRDDDRGDAGRCALHRLLVGGGVAPD